MTTHSPSCDDDNTLLPHALGGWMGKGATRVARAATKPNKALMSGTRSGDLDLRLSSLMAAAQNGDRDAYSDLLNACVPLIRGVASRRVAGDRIDDVLQDVLLTLHRARHTYDPSRSFTAWLRAIADRRAIDVLRRVSRHGAREVYAPLQYDLHIDPTVSPDDSIERAENAAFVRKAVATLAPNQREAIENIMLNERSLKETAALTGKTEGAIKVSLHRALKALRLRFQRGMDMDNA